MEKKYLIFVCGCLILFFTICSSGQSYSLGWQGTDLIPPDQFSDVNRWYTGSSTGESCYVTTDTANVYLHWKFGSGKRNKWALCFQILNEPIALSDLNIIGVDVKGSPCSLSRHIRIKLEDGTNQSTYIWHGLASMTRWCEKLAVLKKQFQGYVNWNKIQVITFEVSSDASANDTQVDSGTVVFRKLQFASVDEWQRAVSFETLKDTSTLDSIKNQTLRGILSRQAANGLFYTWLEDKTSFLYGHGLILKILSIEGQWNQSIPLNVYAEAAEKLALFLVSHQDPKGFWPRAWNTDDGTIRTYVEEYDGTVWMGDFPWIITGLVNYYAKSGDERVLNAIQKARSFLYNLIDSNGRLYTLNIYTDTKYEVTSVEAYAAAILSVYELGDSAKANAMLNYISSKTWDNNLKYWQEAINFPRPVLFANTWMAQLIYNTPDYYKATDALSFVGKTLFTKGPGSPEGFDGIGPVATWYEGTLSYICAGGPGSQMLFDSIVKYRYADGTIPAYNDNFGGKVDVWAVDWSSLDGTAWLYYAAAKSSPFRIFYKSPDIPYGLSFINNASISIYPNPSTGEFSIIHNDQLCDINNISIFNVLGVPVVKYSQKNIQKPFTINLSHCKQGIYYILIETNKDFITSKIEIL